MARGYGSLYVSSLAQEARKAKLIKACSLSQVGKQALIGRTRVAGLKPTVGSTLALRWLRPDWVAPLGSSSLIFNFLFASWLVGTRESPSPGGASYQSGLYRSAVTKSDINGTAVVVLGVILILIFSSINHGLQQSLPVDR